MRARAQPEETWGSTPRQASRAGVGWTKDKLTQLYQSLPESRSNCENYTEDFVACATLSCCPGILINDALAGITVPDAQSNLLCAQIINAEWRNGIRALNGEDMQGVTGRFPDKNGMFPESTGTRKNDTGKECIDT